MHISKQVVYKVVRKLGPLVYVKTTTTNKPETLNLKEYDTRPVQNGHVRVSYDMFGGIVSVEHLPQMGSYVYLRKL